MVILKAYLQHQYLNELPTGALKASPRNTPRSIILVTDQLKAENQLFCVSMSPSTVFFIP